MNTFWGDFIKYSIGSSTVLPECAKEINWKALYNFCLAQGIAGVVFDGLKRSDLRIPVSHHFSVRSYKI